MKQIQFFIFILLLSSGLYSSSAYAQSHRSRNMENSHQEKYRQAFMEYNAWNEEPPPTRKRRRRVVALNGTPPSNSQLPVDPKDMEETFKEAILDSTHDDTPPPPPPNFLHIPPEHKTTPRQTAPTQPKKHVPPPPHKAPKKIAPPQKKAPPPRVSRHSDHSCEALSHAPQRDFPKNVRDVSERLVERPFNWERCGSEQQCYWGPYEEVYDTYPECSSCYETNDSPYYYESMPQEEVYLNEPSSPYSCYPQQCNTCPPSQYCCEESQCMPYEPSYQESPCCPQGRWVWMDETPSCDYNCYPYEQQMAFEEECCPYSQDPYCFVEEAPMTYGSCCSSNRFPVGFPSSRVYVGHTFGQGVEIDEPYSSLGLFMIPNGWRRENVATFIDLWGHYIHDGRWAANIGIGRRCYFPQINATFGVNVNYDYLDGKKDQYHQVGFGTELFFKCLDFRVNGYLPVGDKEGFGDRKIFDDYEDGYVMECRTLERVWGGLDGEVGTCIFKSCVYDIDIYGAFGGFYYPTDCGDSYYGAQGRVQLRFCRYFDVAVLGTVDKVNDRRFQVRLGISYPFGNCPCEENICPDPCLCSGAACRSVQRRRIILSEETCCWKTNFPVQSCCGCR